MKSKRNQDEGIQKLFADGVHKDYIDKPECFQSCPECNQFFANEIYPVLLSCGHIVCQEDMHSKSKICFVCKKPKVEKIACYKGFAERMMTESQIPRGTIKKKTYDFMPRVGKSMTKGKVISNVSQDTTIHSIIMQSPAFNDFFQSTPEGHINVVINSKIYRYLQCKNNKLSDLKDLTLYESSSPHTNIILTVNRMLGGAKSFQTESSWQEFLTHG